MINSEGKKVRHEKNLTISQIFDKTRAAERMEFKLFGQLSAYT